MNSKLQRGFSLLEIMVVLLVFTIVTGAVFGLLMVAQQRYQAESAFLDSFQSARLGLDQITRDVHAAGFPPVNSVPVAIACANPQSLAYAFVWRPGYADPDCAGSTPAWCNMGTSCLLPGDFDLIIETDVDPENANGVEWVHYSLQGNTLMRGQATKIAGANPAATTQPTLTPFIENVMNSPTPQQMADIQAHYNTMFPGNAAVPIFEYTVAAGGLPTPDKITEVNITLIVQSPIRDPKTNGLRVLTLTGLARRINPTN